MNNGTKATLLTAANKVLSPTKLELVKKHSNFENYIAYRQTIAGARSSGLSVGEYIDSTFNVPGATQKTIDHMIELGALHKCVQRVCEIGPGSGRYLEKVIQACHPTSYEIYETAEDWRGWLVETYEVTAQICDGHSLASTPTGSIDLVHAHKVLQGLPIFTVIGYLNEMIRVLNDSGMIVFDVLTEACLAEQYLQGWLQQRDSWVKSMVPKQFLNEFFALRDFQLVGNFFISMAPGITEYFVFSRRA